MKDIREIYQALLDGKTLVNNSGVYLTLENSATVYIEDPEQWSIYNEWEMKPAEWWVRNDGLVGYDYDSELNEQVQKFGMKYHTEELAERARDEMKESNLLRYWASVIDPDWKPDWKDRKQKKWYIEHEVPINAYYRGYKYAIPMLGTVYMSEEAATKICEALNSGELVIGDE